MTKNQEIAWLKKFRETVPNQSYLAGMLDHIIPQFEKDVRSDLETLPNIPEIEKQHRDIVMKRDDAKRALDRLNKQVEEINLDLARLERAKDSALSHARRIAQELSQIR